MNIVPVDEMPKPIDLKPLPTDLKEVYKVCQEMVSVCSVEGGVGLAAVQVGIPWKLFLVRCGDDFNFFVDCCFEGMGEKKLSLERCLSLKEEENIFYKVERFCKIKLFGKQLIVEDGKLVLQDVNKEVEGFDAVVFQHEIQHQQGILLSDIGERVKVWSNIHG